MRRTVGPLASWIALAAAGGSCAALIWYLGGLAVIAYSRAMMPSSIDEPFGLLRWRLLTHTILSGLGIACTLWLAQGSLRTPRIAIALRTHLACSGISALGLWFFTIVPDPGIALISASQSLPVERAYFFSLSVYALGLSGASSVVWPLAQGAAWAKHLLLRFLTFLVAHALTLLVPGAFVLRALLESLGLVPIVGGHLSVSSETAWAVAWGWLVLAPLGGFVADAIRRPAEARRVHNDQGGNSGL